MEKQIIKNFNNFKGRDARSSDLIRDINSAIEFNNARILDEDACVTREGFHIRGDVGYSKGLFAHTYSDKTTGETKTEILALEDELYRKKDTTFIISFTGGYPAHYSHTLISTDVGYGFMLEIEDGYNYTTTITTGTGFEASPVTLANLKTLLETISGVTVAISGDTTIPAAFLPLAVRETFASGTPDTATITVYNWEQVSTLTNCDFTDYFNAYTKDSWEIASAVNMQDCLFLATGYNYLYVYDGQNVYRAGLPIPSAAPTTSLGGTGGGTGFADTSIKYIYLYKQIDNRGNTIYGVDSDPSIAVSPNDQTVTLTLQNILPALEFNTGGAIVYLAQTIVTTINVDSGHTLKVGDTAYFYDAVSASYVEREVLSTGATTIRIAGAGVTVADNAVISNNLRIEVYRTTNAGLLYYKVAEIPNNSFSATQTYADNKAIASLGIQYIPPTKDRDPLEIFPRYLAVHQNLLIATGSIAEPNAWFFSSGESPFYFPALTNYEEIKNTSGGGISGVGSDQEFLIIGTERSLFVISGDLDSFSARQEKLQEGSLGFASHNSIIDVGEGIVFLASDGFWMIRNGYNVVEVGEPINSEFANLAGITQSLRPVTKRAVATFYNETKEYVCFVPSESGSGTAKYANGNSKAHVLATDRYAWALWTGLNMGGGVIESDNKIFFQSRREDSVLTVSGNLWEQNNLGRLDDYADHHLPIAFKLGTQWMEAGEPSIFKTWLWIKFYSLLRSILSASFSLNVSVERDLRRGNSWYSFILGIGQAQSSLGYGYGSWGLFIWGTPQETVIKKKLKSGKAKSIRYVFTNNQINQKVAISAWETFYSPNYRVELKD